MKIDRDTVFKVADLARIAIKEEEVEQHVTEMTKILTFMEKLNELDTTGVEPLVYMNDEENRWREDVVKHEITTKAGLENAALHNESYFLVPKILEK